MWILEGGREGKERPGQVGGWEGRKDLEGERVAVLLGGGILVGVHQKRRNALKKNCLLRTWRRVQEGRRGRERGVRRGEPKGGQT